MNEHVNPGDTIIGKRLIFEGRKVGKVYLISKSGKHRGQRVKLDYGKCWVEVPISLPEKR
ncbi:MAG: hypothetical protein Lokiarch_20050 [Candidatus Lokiarchaeum sp. GC14_75]|nr:MAG: hypothetical protein Lokiarch_20050 [Candidatus Lokiarchaeum sp. GC14_75]